MAWTTPKTWSAEPLTSNDLNTYVRDNQNNIRARQDTNDKYIGTGSGDYTTTSTSLVDVDATNLSLTITTHGGDVLVGFVGIAVAPAANLVTFSVNVDGSNPFSSAGLSAASQHTDTASFVCLIEGLSAGSHTFKLQWLTGGGTATLRNNVQYPHFWVQEV